MRIRITATDVDEGALETARRAEFPSRSLLGSAPADAARHFDVRADGTASPSVRLRRMVQFERESLLDPIGRDDLDLIVCRNVLIYFSLEHQERILARFAQALASGGYLVLGRVERLFGEARGLFDVVSARDRVYLRSADAVDAEADAPATGAGEAPGGSRRNAASLKEGLACA